MADILKEKYPKDLALAQCMADFMKKRQLAERFYSPEIMQDRKKIASNVEAYIPNAESTCKSGSDTDTFTDTPAGGDPDDVPFIKSPAGIVTICVGVVAVIASAVLIGMRMKKSKGMRIPNSDSA